MEIPALEGNQALERQLARKRKSARERKALFYGLLFTSPAILGFLIFTLGPMIASFILSLTDYNVFKDKTSVDRIRQLREAVFTGRTSLFYQSLGTTFYFVVLRVPAVIILSFFLALLLNMNVKGRSVFRTIIYLPSIVPAVASSMIWLWLLNPDLGLVNTVLESCICRQAIGCSGRAALSRPSC